jgi:hypothetical protein
MVERWSMVDYGEDSRMPSMTTEQDGDWVTYEDYQRLASAASRLVAHARNRQQEEWATLPDVIALAEALKPWGEK